MKKILADYGDVFYAALRIVTGLMFACHGAQKVLGVLGGFGGQPGATAPLMSMMGLAGAIELVGGLLIAVGFATGIAAFLSSGLMAAAYWMAHGLQAFFPIVNQGELAVVYCFLFLYIAARGAGRYSIDGSRG